MKSGNSLKLSIIMPVHDAENTVADSIKSLTGQDIDEIILVNDHSSDHSAEIMKEFADGSRIRYIESEGRGVSAARNAGLEMAAGDIIGFCDADDIEEPIMADVVKNTFIAHPGAQIVVTRLNFAYWKNGMLKKMARGGCRPGYWKRDEFIGHTISDFNVMGVVWNKSFRHELIKDIRFDTLLTHCEDTNFSVRAMLRCNDTNIYVSDAITYNYIYNASSTTTDSSRIFDKTTGELKYNEALFKLDRIPGISREVRDAIHYGIFIFSLEYLISSSLSEKSKILLKSHVKEYKYMFFKRFGLYLNGTMRRFIELPFHFRQKELSLQ